MVSGVQSLISCNELIWWDACVGLGYRARLVEVTVAGKDPSLQKSNRLHHGNTLNRGGSGLMPNKAPGGPDYRRGVLGSSTVGTSTMGLLSEGRR